MRTSEETVVKIRSMAIQRKIIVLILISLKRIGFVLFSFPLWYLVNVQLRMEIMFIDFQCTISLSQNEE